MRYIFQTQKLSIELNNELINCNKIQLNIIYEVEIDYVYNIL